MEQYFYAIGIEDDATKFEDGLKPWAKLEFHQQCITKLTIAMAEAKSFVKLSLRKHKFESSKPKETGNGEGDQKGKEDEEGNNDNSKNGGNRKPHNKKWKPNNKMNGLVKYFLCDGLH
ncbi:hypothetical protein J1N35_001742 [Gossypium stocksii]|uniref:Uncharacterized protein n=1 Tax=Gossypium stocksii TaxID=47602 RepID=A0A9D3WKN5_9ROSI|nr:hypothetical protein J1N35_001742 [Gossypium stocksii]